MILLVEEILHQLICSFSQYLQGFIHPRWCRISSINSSCWCQSCPISNSPLWRQQRIKKPLANKELWLVSLPFSQKVMLAFVSQYRQRVGRLTGNDHRISFWFLQWSREAESAVWISKFWFLNSTTKDTKVCQHVPFLPILLWALFDNQVRI